MDTFVKEAAHYVALLAECIAILIVLIGIIRLLVGYFKSSLPLKYNNEEFLTLRSHLGSALSLSLELLIGADILKTAISPTWNEIGMLAAIVVIRTVLNYFLTLEMHSTDKEIIPEQKLNL